MFRKILAGFGALAIAAGIIAVVAGPSAAHHNTIGASIVCSTDNEAVFKITWTIENSESSRSETIIESSDTSLVPVGTTIAAGGTLVVTEYMTDAVEKKLELTARWSNGYEKKNYLTIKPQYDFPEACAPTEIIPTTPAVELSRCIDFAPTDGTYAIPTTAGVVYQVSLDGGAFADAAAGEVTPTTGSTVSIRAILDSSYDATRYVLGGTTTWGPYVFSAADCDDPEPVTPAFVNEECTGVTDGDRTQASYEITAASGVTYQVLEGSTWTSIGAGIHDVNPTSADITVQLRAVMTSTGAVLDSWEHTFTRAGDCIIVVTPVAPTFTDEECTGVTPGERSQARYTVTAASGVTYQVLEGGIWTDVAAGVHNVNPTSTDITVTLRALKTVTGAVLEQWEHTFSSAGDCAIEVAPVDPTITQVLCDESTPGAQTEGGYTIPATANVTYLVQIGEGVATGVAAGFHAVAPGTTFTVIAVADGAGYVLPGDADRIVLGEYTMADPDCLTDISVPGETVTWSDLCDDINGGVLDQGFTVEAAEHVTYTVSFDGATATPIEPGVYSAEPGSHVQITAHADEGYRLIGTSTWEHAFQTDGFCPPTLGVVTPTVSFAQLDCSGGGSYTLGNEEGEPDAILWTVNGGTPFTSGGTFTVSSAGTVTITATPAVGAGFAGDRELPYTWSYTFATPSTCGDLPTLALTGAVAAGSLGLAATLLLAGAVLLAARRRAQAQS
tara:strand:+ start:17998 stop:20178 length:2181 start_codon:yes stop_codon:yes gene_type:complete